MNLLKREMYGIFERISATQISNAPNNDEFINFGFE